MQLNTGLHVSHDRGTGIPSTIQPGPSNFAQLFAYAVMDNDTGNLLEYRHLLQNPKYRDTWSKSFGNKIRHLATTTETIFFINKHEIPIERKGDVTYGRIVCIQRDGKKDKFRTRITMGGNINYPGDCGTPTADLLTVKILLNSIISTPNAKFMSIDIKDFYLKTSMQREAGTVPRGHNQRI
jgi:hypothetical protein